MRVIARLVAAALSCLLPGLPAHAQESVPTPPAIHVPTPDPSSPLLGGVPTGEISATPVALSLRDAIARGLQHNLGVLLQEQALATAHASRWESLTGLLPDVSARVGEARRKSSLAEFGFTDFPGLPGRTVGPFNVFDTRLDVTQPLVDLNALYTARAGAAGVRAARHDIQNARDFVVLVIANLYLNTISATARVDAARAAVTTADALLELANDLKTAGLAAGIDVLRAQVQQQSERQRLIAAENDFAKGKLQLARAIGLPPGQDVSLVDRIPYAPLDNVTLEGALKRAYASRSDFLAGQELLKAAEAGHKAAQTALLPTVDVTGEVARIGTEASSTDFVYGIAAAVKVPLFDRGHQQAELARSDAELRRQRALLGDIRARIDLEVRSALLDVSAAQQALEAAQTGLTLANQQLTQSRDRFSAGVAGSIEVVQSQDAVARANDNYIAALYAHNIAKASLARAIGIAEDAVQSYLGGLPQ
jgi:outer membrane protein TolC